MINPGCDYRRGWVKGSKREDYRLKLWRSQTEAVVLGVDMKSPRLRTGDRWEKMTVHLLLECSLKEGFVQVVSRSQE